MGARGRDIVALTAVWSALALAGATAAGQAPHGSPGAEGLDAPRPAPSARRSPEPRSDADAETGNGLSDPSSNGSRAARARLVLPPNPYGSRPHLTRRAEAPLFNPYGLSTDFETPATNPYLELGEPPRDSGGLPALEDNTPPDPNPYGNAPRWRTHWPDPNPYRSPPAKPSSRGRGTPAERDAASAPPLNPYSG